MSKQLIRRCFAIGVIIGVSIFFRFVALDQIPTGITNDELDYVLNAKSIWMTGKDMSQLWSPSSLTAPLGTFPMAELPAVFMSPFIGPFPLSLLTARFGYALLGSLLPLVLYFLTYQLFHSKRTSFIVGIIAAINPWGIFFSRTCLDAPLAVLFFYVFFLFAVQENIRSYLFSILPYFIAFFSYIGTKIIAIPIALLPLILNLGSKKRIINKTILLLVCSISLTIFFLLTTITNPTKSRMSELFLPSNDAVASNVNTERRLTLPSISTRFLLNKITSYWNISVSKYLNAFSPNLLFLNGDTRSAFSVWTHGYFYIIDILLLFYGFAAMFRKHKKQLLFLLGIILISPIPTVLSTVGISYPIRTSMIFPSLVILIGYGLSEMLSDIKSEKLSIITCFLIIGIYLISASNFLSIYLFRNPIANSEGFDFSSRIVSSYLSRTRQLTSVTVFIGSPKTLYKQYIFYSNRYDKSAISQLSESLKSNYYFIDGITFKSCDQFSDADSISPYIVEPSLACQKVIKDDKRMQITQLSDAGTIYYIYNDRLCEKTERHSYPKLNSFEDLSVEKLADNKFCSLYIIGNNE